MVRRNVVPTARNPRYSAPARTHPDYQLHRRGRLIRRNLPVELHRIIDRYVQQSIPRIRASSAHLNNIRDVGSNNIRNNARYVNYRTAHTRTYNRIRARRRNR